MKKIVTFIATAAVGALLVLPFTAHGAPSQPPAFKIKTVTNTTTVQANNSGGVSVQCPSTYPKVLGGGLDVNLAPSAQEGITTEATAPVGGAGWRVEITNFYNQSVRLKVYARCHCPSWRPAAPFDRSPR